MQSDRRDLEVQEDLPFQKRAWRVERVGWGIMALVIVSALIGLLGPGPLSKTVQWDRSSRVRAEFNRFDHYQAPSTLKVWIDAALVPGGDLPVTLNREFIDQVEISHIDPRPERVETRGEDFIFYFATSSNTPANIVFHYEPNWFGKTRIRLSVSNSSPLNFAQFYFP